MIQRHLHQFGPGNIPVDDLQIDMSMMLGLELIQEGFHFLGRIGRRCHYRKPDVGHCCCSTAAGW